MHGTCIKIIELFVLELKTRNRKYTLVGTYFLTDSCNFRLVKETSYEWWLYNCEESVDSTVMFCASRF